MFSEPDSTIVDYSPGTIYRVPEYTPSISEKEIRNKNVLLASFMVVRTNCEEACSSKLLSNLDENEQKTYRDLSQIGQTTLREFNDDITRNMDSCIRRCFVKRLGQIYGNDNLDYIKQTAFEYQQSDFHYFNTNKVDLDEAKYKLKESPFNLYDKLI